jgi:hypothetical protein
VFQAAESSASSFGVEDLAAQRIFLSKLFGLIAAIVEGSGSFMADRVKNEVWPILSKQLDLFIAKRTNSHFHHHNNTSTKKTLLVEDLCRGSGRKLSGSSDWQTSETILILAVLKCLERVFGEKDCGMALSSLVTSAGTLLLPFLDDNDEKISNASFNALQKIVEIDCDALWRPLLHLSGQWMPLHPLRSPLSVKEDTASLALPTHLLARKAQELITHIESLPEQIIW